MEMKLKRNTEEMMSICFIEFPIGGFRKTQVIPEYVVFYKEVGRLWKECVSYKYLHLTGLWLGVMDRNNATDRNVYSIPHSSSL